MQKVLEYEQHAVACRQIAAEIKNPRYKNSRKVLPEFWGKPAQQRRPGIIEEEPVSG